MIDPRFLRDVQASGWLIHSVDTQKVVAKCPRYGCSLMTYLSPEKPIPSTCRPGRDLAEVPVPDIETGFAFLIQRRHEIGLDQLEMQECIGLTHGHLHKMESGGRVPTVATFLEWAQALGYEMVLRPIGLPTKTLTTIAQTRAQASIRKQRALRQKRRKALPPA